MKILLLSIVAPLLLAASRAAKTDTYSCPSHAKTCTPLEDDEETNDDDCTLYMAPSSVADAGYGVYTTVDIPEGSDIGEPDMFIPIIDRYKTLPYRGQHRWLSWLDYVRGTTDFYNQKNEPKRAMQPHEYMRPRSDVVLMDELYRVDAIVPGIGAATSRPDLVNVELNADQQQKGVLHRGKDPGAGAFTSHYGVTFSAMRDISAGSELYIDAGYIGDKIHVDEEKVNILKMKKKKHKRPRSTSKEPDWLQENAMCIDNLRMGESTIGQAGRGAFAKRLLVKGSVLAPTALAVLKKDDLVIYEADAKAKKYNDVLNKDNIVGTELVLNYCFGHPDSSLLLLPLSPIVNFINHNGTAPNAKLRWPNTDWLDKTHPLDMLDKSGKIVMEYVALRDIQPGEEIFIDYGRDWEEAWKSHVAEFRPEDKDYISAADYLESGQFNVRTTEEQKENPYPSNILPVCFFPVDEDNPTDNPDCWLPCNIDSRVEIDGKKYYNIHFSYKENGKDALPMASWECAPEAKRRYAEKIPDAYISVVDKWNSNDEHIKGAFRHEIGVPNDFFPSVWKQPAVYEAAPLKGPLKPGQAELIRWAHNGKVITPNAHYIGLPANFSSYFLDYCERMGIIDLTQDVLYKKPTKVGEHYAKQLTEGEWYAQRPHKLWNSNMNWISPNDEEGRVSYLRALGVGGFDDVLDGIAKTFNYDGLMCYHNSIIVVSKSDDSFMHTDFKDSGETSFNLLFPLILVNGSSPELDIESEDGNVVVSVHYQYNVGLTVGDWAYHKTHAVDYTNTGAFRVTASVYCADIKEENVDEIAETYRGEEPAPFHDQFDMPIKEWHWRHGEKLLPK